MAFLIIPAMIVGGALAAKSAYEQGQAAKRQGETEAAIAARNAQLAERQADAEQQAAATEALKISKEAKELRGRQIALYAKGGVEMRGTPLAVVVDTAQEYEADRLAALREGAISAAQLRGQAGIYRARGVAAKARGRAKSRAATLQAAGTILTTTGQVGYAYKKGARFPFQKGGLFGS